MEFKFQKRDILKVGVELVVGAGVGIIASNAINMVTPDHLNAAKRASVKIGSFALVWMITSVTSSHVNKFIDDVADGLQMASERSESAKKDIHIFDVEDLNTQLEFDIENLEDGDENGR